MPRAHNSTAARGIAVSDDQHFDDVDYQDDAPESGRKQGMSTGAKVAIILGICVGVAMLVCCGVAAYFMRQVTKAMTTEPAEIAAIRDGIVSQIDVPADYGPMMGMDFTMAGQGMKMVLYGQGTEENPEKLLILMKMMVAADAEQMRREMEKSAGQQRQIVVESSETKTVTIDGQEVDFRFAKGELDNGTPVREVSGAFSGEGGAVMLMLIVPEEEWDERAAIDMLESIKK